MDSALSFSSRVVRRSGAAAGFTTSSGCGSKVTSRLGRPDARARPTRRGEHVLMSAVHAVEGTDGDDRGRNAVERCVRMEQLHAHPTFRITTRGCHDAPSATGKSDERPTASVHERGLVSITRARHDDPAQHALGIVRVEHDVRDRRERIEGGPQLRIAGAHGRRATPPARRERDRSARDASAARCAALPVSRPRSRARARM